ncbi:hypothetical protein TD95_000512 [Thielaviopsis punctulata]|uniref:aldehyde dehydrogenase (NAD(+)) n=1 Tax=Thielaviopsis punctulata TaxID=72032 RepID=A0A0F4Z8Z3_9PEZI|nr:hypothetical protein TD95_000512 [Thielaviopsis punctulata]
MSITDVKFLNIIDGKPVPATKFERCIDPRTEEPLWEVAVASPEDIDSAVKSAQNALVTWGKTTLDERKAKLVQLAECMKENEEILKEYLMRETGKTRFMAGIEIDTSIAQTLYYVKNTLKDEMVYEDENMKVFQTYVPVGIVGAICPWNFPMILANMKIVSSLITGNCVILKPSPFTPYALIKSVELFQSFLPPGVIQIINGGADLGAAMTAHPGISKISFTGTTSTGKRVMEACSKTLKKLTLEMAGNNGSIVCEDIDIPAVAAKIATGGFFNAGQVCVATKRVYVPEAIFDKFIEELEKAVKALYTINEDQEAMSTFGPLSNKMQYDVVAKFFSDCKKNGYDTRTLDQVPSNAKGFWMPPTLVINPPETSMIVQEEQFGPILPIIKYTDLDDALRQVNLDNAGLGASVYSNDLEKANSIARRIEAGSVWINTSERPHQGSFFSGWKDSGYGGEFGTHGLLSYSRVQSLIVSK